MQRRKLGESEIEVAPLMFGGNVFGWTADEATSFRLLDAFVARGFNFIDTADVYSAWVPGHQGGESETLLGKWLRRSGKRNQVVIATKVGMAMGPLQGGLAKAYIMSSVEKSLQRLQVDCIDLYQSHQDDPKTPLEETLEAYSRLIEQGKVRLIGASNYTGERLREAVELARRSGLPAYATLQPEYNLYSRKNFEEDARPVAKELGLGVLPYSSLASGFLSGKYASKEDIAGTSREKRLEGYFDERGMRILKALRQVANEVGAECGAVAVAWLMARPTVLAPIASATSVQQLESNLRAANLTFSPRQMQMLDEASAY
jgi:aryl-alcohol dehydrogenase-like predicted oxidoreductase